MKRSTLVASLALVCAAAASTLFFLSRTGGSGAIEGRNSTVLNSSGPERQAADPPATERVESVVRTPAVEKPRRDPKPRAAPMSMPTPRSPAAIAGRVVDAAGLPAPDAQVEIDSIFQEQRSALVDGAGQFVFENLSPGRITLRASTERAITETSVTVGGGERVLDLVLVLQPAGAVAGVVLDAQGDPLAGRIVYLMRGIDEVQDRISAEDGSFHFAGVLTGEYSVVTWLEDDQADEAAELESTWSAAARVEEGRTARVVLRPSEREAIDVHGIVTRAGNPVAAVELLFLRDGSMILGTARAAATDERGAYSARLDGPGRFALFADARDTSHSPQFVALVAVPPLPALERDVALPTGGIEGHVLGPVGGPVRASIHAMREDRFLELAIFEDQPEAQSDRDGRYSIDGLLPGLYTLRIEPHGTELADSVMERIRVDAGTVRADVALNPAGRVHGRVIDAEGRPVEGAVVHACDARGRVMRSTGSARSDAAGGFVCERLPLGLVTLSARTAAAVSTESSVAVLATEHTPEVVLSLSPGSRLTVSISDRDGHPVSAGIRLLDERGRDVSLLLPPGAKELAMVRGISTSEADFGPLRPGAYRAIAVTTDGRHIERELRLEGEPEVRVELRLGD